MLTGPLNHSGTLHDPTLLRKIPAGVDVVRTRHWDSKVSMRRARRLRIAGLVRALTPWFPSMEAGWIRHGYAGGVRILEEGGVDLIYSSSYPVSSHVVAYLLKRHTGLPWVADYRDEWSIRSVISWPTPLHRAAATWMDGKLMASADRVVTTSPVDTEAFRKAFPDADPLKYVTIRNGFDEDDFLEGSDADPDPSATDRFTLAHVGLFHGWRAADGLLAAIRRLIEAGTIPQDRIRLLFVGKTVGLTDSWLEERGVLKVMPPVPHGEAVRVMQAADALLLLNIERENILGKTFEYLAARRSILALMPSGATADVVREARAATVRSPEDVDGIAEILADHFRRWNEGRLESDSDPVVVERYSRRGTTERLASLFEETLAQITGRPSPQPAELCGSRHLATPVHGTLGANLEAS